MGYFKFLKKSLPITIGMILTLIALCCLVEFYDQGLYFEGDYFIYFVTFFFIGFPLLMFGINKMADNN